MRKVINQSGLKNAFGDPYRFISKDDNGRPLLDENQQIVIVDGDTCDLISSLLERYAGIKWAFWNGDSKPFARVMEAVNECRSSESDEILFNEGDYEWLVGDGQGKVGILDRKMPESVRATQGVDEENPLAHPTLGMTVWGANEASLRAYLKASD